MDLNKIIHLARDNQLLLPMIRNPLLFHREQARKISFNDWLKVYQANHKIAEWMLCETVFNIGRFPSEFHLPFYELQPTNEHLIYFLKQNQQLNSIIIDSSILTVEIIPAIENLCCLTSLSIEYYEPRAESLDMQLEHLEVLMLSSLQEDITLENFKSITKYPKLRRLSLSNVVLTPETTKSIRNMTLESLEICYPVHRKHTRFPRNLFHNKRRIVLRNCSEKIVDKLFREGSDEATDLHVDLRCYHGRLSLKNIANFRTLTDIYLDVEITSIRQFRNYVKILDATQANRNIDFSITIRAPVVYFTEEETSHWAKLKYTDCDLFRKSLFTYLEQFESENENVFLNLKRSPYSTFAL